MSEIAELRKKQSGKVMRLIGPLLDAWDGLSNDTALMSELTEVRKFILRIHTAMGDS
jgi:hypothetical protein